MADGTDDIPGGPPPPTPPPPNLPSLPDYGDVGPYFDPAGQPYVPLPGQAPGEFDAPQIGAPTYDVPPGGEPGGTPGGGDLPLPGDLPGGGFTNIGGSPFGFGAMFGGGYYPGLQKRSKRELERLMGEGAPGVGLGAIFNLFKGRRVYRPSPAERAVRTLYRRGVNILERGVRSIIPTFEKVIPNTTARGVVVYRPPAPPWYRGLGRVLGANVLGGIVEMLIPHTLGSGELPPGGLKPSDVYGPIREANRRYRIQRGIEREFRPLFERAQRGEYNLHPLPRTPPRPDKPQAQVDENFRFYGLIRPYLPDLGQMIGDAVVANQDRERRVMPGTPRASAPSSEPQASTGTKQVTVGGPGSQAPPRRHPRIGLGVGAIATGLVLESIRRGGSRGGPEPGAGFAPILEEREESRIPAPTPLTTFNTVSLQSGFVGGGSAVCDCAPRGPRRKCLQRANVKWAGGPRKGKAAGSKCIRYAARRTR